MKLEDRIVIVTGASSGIGEATARRLAAEGMQVVAAARREDRLHALAAENPRITPLSVDVTDLESVTEMARTVAERFGACHALVNNAGVSGGNKVRGPADLVDVERVMDVNFTGAVRCTTALAELLFASAPSRVVNIASIAGKVGVGRPAYSASKFALVGFSEALGQDWARKGVTVTQLNPGFIRTEGFPQDHLMRSPLRRLVGRPDDVADAVVDVLRRGPRERSVPRWYRPIVALRHVAAPLFWTGARNLR